MDQPQNLMIVDSELLFPHTDASSIDDAELQSPKLSNEIPLSLFTTFNLISQYESSHKKTKNKTELHNI